MGEAAGRPFPYATIDARGHIFDAFDQIPELEATLSVPGQVESCVAILRNMLAAPLCSAGAGADLMIRYVDTFLRQAPRAAVTKGGKGGEKEQRATDGKDDPAEQPPPE